MAMQKVFNTGIEEFHQLRSDLLNKVLLWVALVALPELLLLLLRASCVGSQPIMLTQLSVLGLFWLVVFGRKHLRYLWRIYLLLFMLWSTAFVFLAYLGPMADSKVFLVALPLFAMLFLEGRAGWWVVLAVFLSYVFLGVAATQNWLGFAVDYHEYAHHPLPWLLSIWNISAYSAIIAYVIWQMMRYLHGRLQVVVQTEQLLRELGDSIPDGAIYRLRFHADGRRDFPYFSAAFAQVFGIDTQRVQQDGKALYEKVLAQDLEVLERLEVISRRDLMPLEHMFRLYDRQGRIRWVHCRAMPQPDAEGGIVWNGVLLDVSERKTAEQQCQRSEARLQQIIDSLPVGVGVIDSEHHILMVNQRFTSMFGYRAEDIPTINAWAEVSYPDPEYRNKTLQQWRNDVEKAIAKQRETPTREYQVIAKNGHAHQVEVTLSPGLQEHVICFVDISTRRQVEASLHIYQQMVSSTSDMMAFLDCNFVYQKTNLAYAKNWRHSSGEMLGKSIDEVLGQAVADQLRPYLQSCLRGKTERFQMWRTFPRVGKRFVDVVYTPYRETQNNISGVTASVRDLTELQQARDALQQSEVRYRSLFEAAGDLIFVHPLTTLENSGRFIEVNQIACDTLGYSKSELLQRSPLDLLGAENFSKVNQEADKLRRDGYLLFEREVYTAQNEVLCLEFHSRMFELQGEPMILSLAHDISRRKQAEYELQRLTELLKDTQNMAQIGGWELDIKTGQTHWTEGIYRIYELPKSFVHTQDNGLEYYHPADRPALQTALDKAISEGKSFDLECRLTSAEGRRRWVRVIGKALWEAQQIVKVHGALQDISQRKHYEQTLRQQEQRLQFALKAAGAGTFYYDFEQDYNTWDQGSLDIFSVPPHTWDASLNGWIKCIHPEDKDTVKLSLKNMLSNHEDVFEHEYRIVHPNGEVRHVRTPCYRVRDAQGNAIGISGLHFDISEQKLTELRLRHSRERLRLATAAGGIGTWEWRLSDNSLVWDEQMFNLYRKPTLYYSFPYADWINAIHPEDRSAIETQLQKALDAQLPRFAAQFRILWADGSVRYLQANAELRNAENSSKAVRMLGVSWDVTAQKHSEREIIQAREAAEAANHAKSVFLANMSHELRTPLNAIMGYAQHLEKRSDLPNAQRNMANSIYRSSDYLLTLITDILDLAKIEANRLDIIPAACDLMPFIQNLSDVFRMRAEQKHIGFSLRIAQDLPACVEIDEKRLRQILMNLLSNAVKFTEHGEVRLDIRYQAQSLHIVVEDTGIGIAAEQQNTIFEPFQQAGESRYRAQGTGLGLAICRKLISLMQGRLSLESHPAQGSRFSLQLPAPPSFNRASNQPPHNQTPVSYRSLSSEHTLHILLVDDVKDNRSMLRTLLESLGFGIQEANRGEACLALVKQWRPDLILLDLRMPGIDGLETARRLRTLPAMTNLPIIMVSASVFAEDQAKTLAAGCNAYLAKPIQTQLLYQLLQQYLPLQWIYAPSTDISFQPTAASATEKLPTAAAEQLLQLLKAGNINQIKEYLQTLQTTGNYPVLLSRLQEQLQRFQLQDMRSLVRTCQEKTEP